MLFENVVGSKYLQLFSMRDGGSYFLWIVLYDPVWILLTTTRYYLVL